MRAFTLKVEPGHDGLICVTSPEHKGLFVAEETLADALLAASHLVRSLDPDEGEERVGIAAPSGP